MIPQNKYLFLLADKLKLLLQIYYGKRFIRENPEQ
jgi:hypothetical protein